MLTVRNPEGWEDCRDSVLTKPTRVWFEFVGCAPLNAANVLEQLFGLIPKHRGPIEILISDGGFLLPIQFMQSITYGAEERSSSFNSSADTSKLLPRKTPQDERIS